MPPYIYILKFQLFIFININALFIIIIILFKIKSCLFIYKHYIFQHLIFIVILVNRLCARVSQHHNKINQIQQAFDVVVAVVFKNKLYIEPKIIISFYNKCNFIIRIYNNINIHFVLLINNAKYNKNNNNIFSCCCPIFIIIYKFKIKKKI